MFSSLARRLKRCRNGSSAVEFALIAPILLLMIFGIIAYGHILGIYHSVQQVASEAARASVAGLDDTERGRIAQDFVSTHASSYALLEPARLRIVTRATGFPTSGFEVAASYDLSGTPLYALGTLVALPPPVIERRAVVARGGY